MCYPEVSGLSICPAAVNAALATAAAKDLSSIDYFFLLVSFSKSLLKKEGKRQAVFFFFFWHLKVSFYCHLRLIIFWVSEVKFNTRDLFPVCSLSIPKGQKKRGYKHQESLATPLHSQIFERASSGERQRGEESRWHTNFTYSALFWFAALGTHPNSASPRLLGTILSDRALTLPVTSLKFRRREAASKSMCRNRCKSKISSLKIWPLYCKNISLGRLLQEHSACYNCNKMTETMAKSFESQADCSYGLQLLIHSQDSIHLWATHKSSWLGAEWTRVTNHT